jgi:hypothetical protein
LPNVDRLSWLAMGSNRIGPTKTCRHALRHSRHFNASSPARTVAWLATILQHAQQPAARAVGGTGRRSDDRIMRRSLRMPQQLTDETCSPR